MKYALFYHSFSSCWNHGNAHFLRGVVRELSRQGHDVEVYEPEGGWSRANALQDGGIGVLEEAERLVPTAKIIRYEDWSVILDAAVADADVVMVHEWNPPALVAALGEKRKHGARFVLLFHDTHHRAVTAPEEIEAFDLEAYDSVLVFGETLREIYDAWGWGSRAFTWHEAADTALFRPLQADKIDTDLIWIGNWGDGERAEEIGRFICEPVAENDIRARIHGVRYPDEALLTLAAHCIEFGGWLPNHRAPSAFSRACFTVHVPRRAYVAALPGIPTIRVFEALACGIPLISAPWRDEEGLFLADTFLTAHDATSMAKKMRLILNDTDAANEMSMRGLKVIADRHTCAHRVRELIEIVARLAPAPLRQMPEISSPEATAVMQ